MDKWHLRKRKFLIILKQDVSNLLGFLHLKKYLRSTVIEKLPIQDSDIKINDKNKTIVVFPNIPWNYRKQRPQHIFKGLSERGFNIFYLSPIISDKEFLYQVDKNIFEVYLKGDSKSNILSDLEIKEMDKNKILESLNKVIGEYMKEDFFVFVEHPIWKDIALKIDKAKIVYDLMDLYSGFPNAKKELIKNEEELVSKSDTVITTADNLYNYAKKLNKDVHIVRNGCDFKYFSSLKRNGELDALIDRPIIGYFGAINDWFDMNSLEYVVKQNKDKYFVLIGAVNTNKARRISRYRNVFFLGEIKYELLGGYLAYFDVCIIPFVKNDLTMNTNPVKFYEYISSGKPVVSVRLPELEKYSDICYLYNTKEEFSKNIFRALHEDDKNLCEKRKITAKENSWDNRVESIIKILRV